MLLLDAVNPVANVVCVADAVDVLCQSVDVHCQLVDCYQLFCSEIDKRNEARLVKTKK